MPDVKVLSQIQRELGGAVAHFSLMLERGENVTIGEYLHLVPKQYHLELTKALEAVVIAHGMVRNCKIAGVTERTIDSWLKPQNEEERKQDIRPRQLGIMRQLNEPYGPIIADKMDYSMWDYPGDDEREELERSLKRTRTTRTPRTASRNKYN